MALPQTMLGLAVGGGTLAAAGLINYFVQRFRLVHALPRIGMLYRLLDPLLARVNGRWSGSQLRFATELLVALLADGELKASEVAWAADQVSARFDPIRAADHAQSAQALTRGGVITPELQAVQQVIQVVEKGTFAATGAVAAAQSIRSVLQGVL